MSIQQALDPGLRINHPHILHAYEYVEGLVVYRSVLVKDTDDIYKPVMDHIATKGLIEVYRTRFEDDGMLFGEAEVIHHTIAGGG